MNNAKALEAIKMKSMKLPKETVKETPVEPACSHDEFPWGLGLDLNDKTLKMLGASSDDFAVGTEVHIVAVAKVTRVSKSASEDGGGNESVDLQVTRLGIETMED